MIEEGSKQFLTDSRVVMGVKLCVGDVHRVGKGCGVSDCGMILSSFMTCSVFMSLNSCSNLSLSLSCP